MRNARVYPHMDVLSAPKVQRFLTDCHDHRPLGDDAWVDDLPLQALRQRFPKAREAFHELIGVQYATSRQRLDVALLLRQDRPQENVLVAASEKCFQPSAGAQASPPLRSKQHFGLCSRRAENPSGSQSPKRPGTLSCTPRLLSRETREINIDSNNSPGPSGHERVGESR